MSDKANFGLREIVAQSVWLAVSKRGIRTLRSAKKHSVGTVIVTERGEISVAGAGVIAEVLGFHNGKLAMRFAFWASGNVEFSFTPELARI